MSTKRKPVTPIRLAIIGAGHLGKIHTRLAHANDRFEVVGVVDPLECMHAQIREQFNLPTPSHFRFLVDDIDAAIIATPTVSHYEIAAALIRYGKHVLVEKPLTLYAFQAQSLVNLAQQHGVVLQVGHVERFNAAWRAICNQVGEIRYLEAKRTSGFTFRSIDVGAVFDLMIHDIDLALSCIGDEVSNVSATGMSVLGRNEDMAQARIEFNNGAVANLTASRCSFEANRTIQVIGSKGFAAADLTTGAAKLIQAPTQIQNRGLDVYQWSREQQLGLKESMFTDLMSIQQLQITPVNAIDLQHHNFADSIASSTQPTVCGRAGLRAVQVAERILNRINGHQWVFNGQAMTGPLAPCAEPVRKKIAA
jgi:predicted dehydrogenase